MIKISEDPLQSYCEIMEINDISNLEIGMDFRKPEYRREVFLRFYQFHTKYNSHPGAVYYAFPYLFEYYGMSTEERYWFCFINGLCQNVLTTHEIWTKFPTLKGLKMQDFSDYFRRNYLKFGWDTDRRYVKNSFEKAVQAYIDLLAGRTQEEYFSELCGSKSDYNNFNLLWNEIMDKFYLFGRLSTFSYLEYLRIAGLNIQCSQLFIHDIQGSKSHRNGLCKVLGRDDLDWHDKYNPEMKGYTEEQLKWLTLEGNKLLYEAQLRIPTADFFTLESTLCCYKSWFRPNRRYPNVYNDMFYERILKNEEAFGRRNELFRQIRQEKLPKHLRIEDNLRDPGLCKEKQNHFRETGEVIMMDQEWECFTNSFNKKYYSDGF